MMNHEAQLKLQAFLDGELPEAEARGVANQLATDREAVALMGELRNTRQAMKGFEALIRVPESREFYWSRIQREIERLEPAPEPLPRRGPGLLATLRRLLVPVAGVAAAVVACLMLLPRGNDGRISFAPVETALADTGAFTYRDFSSGTTLVWVSYPAEKEFSAEDDFDTFN